MKSLTSTSTAVDTAESERERESSWSTRQMQYVASLWMLSKGVPKRFRVRLRKNNVMGNNSHRIHYFERDQKINVSQTVDTLSMFLIKFTFLLKTEMVRMVHRSLFYNTEMKFWMEKKELWRTTELVKGGEVENSGLRSKFWLLRVVLGPKWYLKRLWRFPPLFWLNFHMKLYHIQLNLMNID